SADRHYPSGTLAHRFFLRYSCKCGDTRCRVAGRSVEHASMKMILASVFTVLLTIVMTLAAMFTLVRATLVVTSLASPLQRRFAVTAELFLGVVLLLGTTWLATHLAVRIFRNSPVPTDLPGGPVG